MIFYFLGALIGSLFLIALCHWLIGFKMGNTNARLLTSFGVAYAAMFLLSGWGNANGGPFNPWPYLPIYTLAFACWFAIYALAFKKQHRPASNSNYRRFNID